MFICVYHFVCVQYEIRNVHFWQDVNLSLFEHFVHILGINSTTVSEFVFFLSSSLINLQIRPNNEELFVMLIWCRQREKNMTEKP